MDWRDSAQGDGPRPPAKPVGPLAPKRVPVAGKPMAPRLGDGYGGSGGGYGGSDSRGRDSGGRPQRPVRMGTSRPMNVHMQDDRPAGPRDPRFASARLRGAVGPAGWSRGVRVVHEDEDVLVLEKPVGMLTAGQPGETRQTLFDEVKAYVRATGGRALARAKRAAKEQGLPRSATQGTWIIHRLDKDASGVLVFAKSVTAFERLKEDFKSKRVHRIYLALVEGEMGPVGKTGTVQSFIREEESGSITNIKTSEFRGSDTQGDSSSTGAAKLAVTHYKVIGVGKGMTLVQVRLETGRKNQIRIHLSGEGFPLVGDLRYGSKNEMLGRLGLHASELGFGQPSTGVSVRFTAPAPAAFYRAVGMEVPASAGPDILPEAPERIGPGMVRGGKPLTETSWEPVAGWYDELLTDRGSDHYEHVILPGVLRLMQPLDGQRVLDVACGQGIATRRMAELGSTVVGVDVSPGLIAAAQQHGGDRVSYRVGDVRELGALGLEGGFDAATCVMGMTNIEPLGPVLSGLAALLKPGGRFVFVLQHPAFRIADQTAWGWDDRAGKQFRRVDGYLSPAQKAIVMNPGAVSSGNKAVTTITFHRPFQTYVRLLAEAGFAIDAMEEWPAQRTSTAGPRAAEENRSRAEIPLFAALRARKM